MIFSPILGLEDLMLVKVLRLPDLDSSMDARSMLLYPVFYKYEKV